MLNLKSLFFRTQPNLGQVKSKLELTEMGPFEKTLAEWQSFFESLPRPYLSLPQQSYEVFWNKKMRTRAGLCVPNQNRIELNPNILTDPKDFESTLVHELCHLVIYRSWPRAEAHGAKWKSLMKLCGFEAERCHRIESPLKRVQKTWSLYCQCESPHQVKTRTYNKISKRRHRYICKSCHQTLTQEPKKT